MSTREFVLFQSAKWKVPPLDDSPGGQAATFLRRKHPNVYRSDKKGNFLLGGQHWYVRPGLVLDEDGMVKYANSLGATIVP